MVEIIVSIRYVVCHLPHLGRIGHPIGYRQNSIDLEMCYKLATCQQSSCLPNVEGRSNSKTLETTQMAKFSWQ